MTNTLKELKEASEEKRLKVECGDKPVSAAHTTTLEKSPPTQRNPFATSLDLYRERIAQSEAKITNLEYEIMEEKERLLAYRQNLHECQNEEGLSSIVERDRRAEYWLEQIQTKYRHYQDIEVAMMLDKAGFSTIDLCYLVMDMAKIIKVENRKNIEAIFNLVDCNGMVTTPGFDPKRASILQQIWNRPFDTNSRTAKPADIHVLTDRFALELSFQKTLDIIRHCATVEHNRRSTKNKSDEQKERDRRIIEEWEQHPELQTEGMMSAFCRYIDTLGIRDASESTIRRVIKKHNKNS